MEGSMGHNASVADRSRAVLVIVDIQERLAAAMERREEVLQRTSLLAGAARIVGIPVVVTRQYPRGLGDIEQALADELAEWDESKVHRVDKMTFDCFGQESFGEALSNLGRDQLVFAGMESHICVTQTALAALRAGMDVHVAADACCSRDEVLHGVAMSRLTHAGATITCAESVAYELVGCAGTDEFRALLAVVKGQS
jgi:nicotinamidase-related amidase